jgi:hypothetical protein
MHDCLCCTKVGAGPAAGCKDEEYLDRSGHSRTKLLVLICLEGKHIFISGLRRDCAGASARDRRRCGDGHIETDGFDTGVAVMGCERKP